MIKAKITRLSPEVHTPIQEGNASKISNEPMIKIDAGDSSRSFLNTLTLLLLSTRKLLDNLLQSYAKPLPGSAPSIRDT